MRKTGLNGDDVPEEISTGYGVYDGLWYYIYTTPVDAIENADIPEVWRPLSETPGSFLAASCPVHCSCLIAK
jgi:hypothetical protein